MTSFKMCLQPASQRRKRGGGPPTRARMVHPVHDAVKSPGPATISAPVQVNLRETWWIGEVEIPGRLVLAPMAGVSVQAFRRQGRRFGAGLVCSEMVSCAGIEHRNE